jgi:threonine synthase
MKTVFADAEYKAKYQLGAVNSVNWARVLAQIVYYGYASLRSEQASTFCVPTGNFGNVFAAYLAQRMGFPICHLLVATNDNDILARFFATGRYSRGDVHQTLSPAMDIQVASNFERFLFYYFDQDSQRLTQFMQDFAANGEASIGAPPEEALMSSVAVTREQTLQAMRDVHQQFGYVLDPHTAVGYYAAKERVHNNELNPAGNTVVVGTAHPAKFPEAVVEATGVQPTHPTLQALDGLPMRRQSLPCDIEAVKAYLAESLAAE